MIGPIQIAPISDEEAALWDLAREIGDLMAGLSWVLVGGLMVRTLEAEHAVATTVTTGDLDAVLDVRAVSTATRQAAERLLQANFTSEHDADSLAYRFRRGSDVVDVLAPDNLGRRADLTTVPPEGTLEAIGGTQALRRRRTVTIDPGNGSFDLPLPSLLGGIIIKARVVASTRGRESEVKHRRDLARLLAHRVVGPDRTDESEHRAAEVRGPPAGPVVASPPRHAPSPREASAGRRPGRQRLSLGAPPVPPVRRMSHAGCQQRRFSPLDGTLIIGLRPEGDHG